MTLPRIWPLGMVGRIAVILFAALLLELFGNLALHRWQDRELISGDEVHVLTGRLADAQRIAATAPPADRARLLGDISAPGMALNWVPRTVIIDFTPSIYRLLDMRARIVKAAPALADRPLRLSILPSAQAGQRDLVGAMQLADGSFVTFRVSPYLAAPPGLAITILLHLLLTGAVMIAALLMVRALVRPLRDLARAADATGRRQAVEISLRGPHEVRRVAAAFAAMQDRLLTMVEDHSRAMIAVSHDLRTPIQRLRLRAALVADGDISDQMVGDLIEMERFIGSTLDYVREDREEAPKLVDVAAIVTTAVDDAADAGIDIAYRGPDELTVTTRPLAIKRVLGNLIDNAARHARRVEISLIPEDGCFTLSVEDDGPGIPADRREEMLLPFRRLEAHVGPTGGAGLGLAICDRIVGQMDGTLTLAESTLGGLRVAIRL